MEDFLEEKIRETIKSLTPKNLILCISSRSHENICTMTEPIYGTKYLIEAIP